MTVTRILIALAPSAVVAVGNYAVGAQLGAERACVPCLAWLVGGPLLLGIALTFLLPRSAVPVHVEPAPPPPPPEPTTEAALRLLCVLQEEGRLIDFLQEDLAPYPDDQIGAAVRGIHEGCRKALSERVALTPVLPGAEGDAVTVEPGFDPAAIRLTGNVSGAPPFRGVLRHGGWRAGDARLTERPGRDPHLLAPAEVEIG